MFRGVVFLAISLLSHSGLCAEVSSKNLYDALHSLAFLSSGVINQKDDRYIAHNQPCLYLEPENVTAAEYAWATTGSCDLLYKSDGSSNTSSQCLSIGPILNGTDLPGADMFQVVYPAGTQASTCANKCCATDSCYAWTFAPSAPSAFGSCIQGKPCCYLKGEGSSPSPNPTLQSGTVTREPFRGVAPPLGIRSSVPLGGIACGTVELRANGQFTAWTIQNQSPAGGAKLSIQPTTFMAVGVDSDWRVAQTTPPSGLAGVAGLRYQGNPPVSRLDVLDPTLPAEISLFAYSSLVPGDMNASHIPAVKFTEAVRNTAPVEKFVTFLFQLGLTINVDTTRPGTAYASHNISSPSKCATSCVADTQCSHWRIRASTPSLCEFMKYDPQNPPFNSYESGTFSGLRYQWSIDTNTSSLTVNFPGSGPMHGNITIAITEASNATVFEYTATNPGDGVNARGFHPFNPSHPYGGVGVMGTLPPGANATFTIVMTYFFPYRNYLAEKLGNYYNNKYANSMDVVKDVANSDFVGNVQRLHRAFTESSLPDWMSDSLLASLHHIRSAAWFADGRWRQWEAYDCVNVDSVHNDGERHIPYIMLFPEAVVSKLNAWAKYQLPNGMIQEQLACGCMGGIDPNFEYGCGRVMSDVSSMFVMYVYELYRWWPQGPDVLKSLYQNVKRAAQWHISVSTANGLPAHLITTYDILELERYDASTYSNVFHMMTMKAMLTLSKAMGDTEFVATAQAALDRATLANEQLMWNNTNQFYRAYTGGENAVFSDSFYAQVLAYTGGMGTLVNASRLQSHLQYEERTNFSPFGLIALTGRFSGNTVTERDVWMMSPPNHATLMLRLGMSTTEALTQASLSYIQVRDVQRDLWATAGIIFGNYGSVPGNAQCTSHYGYHMTLWHTMLALSGQDLSLPDGFLRFAPVTGTPFSYPVMAPGGVVGMISQSGNTFTFEMLSGSLTVNELSVGGKKYPANGNPIVLTPGTVLKWS
eukprot:PhF_6_TR11553/c0_g1_i1/m.18566